MNGFNIFKGVCREFNHLRATLSPVKRRIRSKWTRQDGVVFVREQGVSEGDVVLDFGCGSGSYSIPFARVVGKSGMVVAIDRRKRELGRLQRGASAEGLHNILIASDLGQGIALLKGRLCKTVLLYDVLHFLPETERAKLYDVFYGILNPNGVLSVHPKHVKGNHASRHLRTVTEEDLTREIESARFRLLERKTANLWHSHERENGIVLNFGQTLDTKHNTQP